MNINKNKGMFLESVINNSIEHYQKNKIALFRKLDIPVKIIEINDNNQIIGKIYKKSDVDYYGVYQGRFIVIEAKQTDNDVFYLHKIQEHQVNFLNEISNIYLGISLLIIYFVQQNQFFCFPWNKISSLKKINSKDPQFNQYKINIFFPGRINFLDIIKKMYH